MFRKSTRLTTLALRKKLLLAESELNRAALLKEIETLKDEVTRLKKQALAVGSVASSAALVASAFSLFRRHSARAKQSSGGEKPSWIYTALAGARIGTSLFLKIKSLFRERD
jgi:hypothetical protein